MKMWQGNHCIASKTAYPLGRNARRRARRRGVVLFAVVAILLVASLILFSWLKQSVMQRQIVRQQSYALQSQWLAESALTRAQNKLRLDPEYHGETWNIAAGLLGADAAAQVEIKIEQAADNRPAITVSAQYPLNSPHMVRWNKNLGN